MSDNTQKLYKKFVKKFILGRGYVLQPMVIITAKQHAEETKGGKYQNVFYEPYDTDINQRAADLIESLDAMIQEAMGEWYAIASAYMPEEKQALAEMRDAIARYAELKDDRR